LGIYRIRKRTKQVVVEPVRKPSKLLHRVKCSFQAPSLEVWNAVVFNRHNSVCHFITRHHTALHCTTLHGTTPGHTTHHCTESSVVGCSTLQCSSPYLIIGFYSFHIETRRIRFPQPVYNHTPPVPSSNNQPLVPWSKNNSGPPAI
jgi:hypothetical protein